MNPGAMKCMRRWPHGFGVRRQKACGPRKNTAVGEAAIGTPGASFFSRALYRYDFPPLPVIGGSFANLLQPAPCVTP
jgi:hypothetical protein